LTWPGGGKAWMETGNALFNIDVPGDYGREDATPIAQGVKMKVYVDDVDQHFSHAEAEGAKIISGPADGFWGGRIYRVLDHEGHQWEIAQRGRDLAADRWQLPPGVTRGAPE
jgi:uncharacterized glyoxalase superfamily protein PhnB